MPYRQLHLLLITLLLLSSVVADHITDKLAVGLYPQANTEDTPLKILRSGDHLNVLETQETFAKVQTSDGTEGYVELDYLTQEKPANVRLLETQVRVTELQNELDRARKRILELADEVNPAATAVPIVVNNAENTKELANLRERMRQAVLLLQNDTQTVPSAIIENSRETAPNNTEGAKTIETTWYPGPLWGYWPWVGMLLTLLIGIAAGVGLVDYRIRRRYGGGFRI